MNIITEIDIQILHQMLSSNKIDEPETMEDLEVDIPRYRILTIGQFKFTFEFYNNRVLLICQNGKNIIDVIKSTLNFDTIIKWINWRFAQIYCLKYFNFHPDIVKEPLFKTNLVYSEGNKFCTRWQKKDYFIIDGNGKGASHEFDYEFILDPIDNLSEKHKNPYENCIGFVHENYMESSENYMESVD